MIIIDVRLMDFFSEPLCAVAFPVPMIMILKQQQRQQFRASYRTLLIYESNLTRCI